MATSLSPIPNRMWSAFTGFWRISRSLRFAIECRVRLLFTTMAVMILAASAQAQSWYLMAPDEKIVGDPRVAIRMEHGPVMGPLEFVAREKFSSRVECEPARQQLVGKWR